MLVHLATFVFSVCQAVAVILKGIDSKSYQILSDLSTDSQNVLLKKNIAALSLLVVATVSNKFQFIRTLLIPEGN